MPTLKLPAESQSLQERWVGRGGAFGLDGGPKRLAGEPYSGPCDESRDEIGSKVVHTTAGLRWIPLHGTHCFVIAADYACAGDDVDERDLADVGGIGDAIMHEAVTDVVGPGPEGEGGEEEEQGEGGEEGEEAAEHGGIVAQSGEENCKSPRRPALDFLRTDEYGSFS